MYMWFLEVFSTNSDKARLVSILISSLIAVFILLLNHWFNQKRERSKHLIDKIEHLSKLIAMYDREARKFFFEYDENDPKETQPSPRILAAEAIEDIEMLLHLYFPKRIFCTYESQFQKLLNLSNTLIEYKGQGLDEVASWDAVRTLHAEDIKNMRTKCRELMSIYT